jgi:predicted nucleotidyltransferase
MSSDRLFSVILFGSQARGEATKSYDVITHEIKIG